MQTQLTNADTNELLLNQLAVADTFWKRLRGLQFRKTIPGDSGILLMPCSSLHTCFMRFPIDVIMLDKDNTVLATRRDVQPWRIVFCVPGTVKVVETFGGRLRVDVGMKLAWGRG